MNDPRRPRVVLVTGASSGIGLATSLLAASRGDHLVLAARGADALASAEAACAAAGAASTLVVPTDVGDDEDVAQLVEATLHRHDRLDAVVNSAGVVSYGRVEQVPAEVFDKVLQTNLLGSVNMARHAIPVLRAQGEGSLLLVGSVIGHISVPTMTPYVLSKWGVRILARQIALENRDVPGLNVGYVAPGGVDTPIYQQAANYVGFEGRPPPPVADPERVARQILDRVDRPRHRSQLTLANDVIRFGFVVLPPVYDALVGRLLPIGAIDQRRPVAPSSGNVLEPQADRNHLRGDQGSAVVGVVRNISSVVTRTARR